jgi:hypothetical protein
MPFPWRPTGCPRHEQPAHIVDGLPASSSSGFLCTTALSWDYAWVVVRVLSCSLCRRFGSDMRGLRFPCRPSVDLLVVGCTMLAVSWSGCVEDRGGLPLCWTRCSLLVVIVVDRPSSFSAFVVELLSLSSSSCFRRQAHAFVVELLPSSKSCLREHWPSLSTGLR